MKKIEIKKPTLATSLLLNKFNIDITSGSSEDVIKYVYIHSNNLREINRLTLSELEDNVIEFADMFEMNDIAQFIEIISNHFKEVEESYFTVESQDGKKSKVKATRQVK